MAKKGILFVVEAIGSVVFTFIVDLANELVKNYGMYIAYAVRPQIPAHYIAWACVAAGEAVAA